VRIVTVDVLNDDALLDRWVAAAVDSGRYEFGDRHSAFSADEVRAAEGFTTYRIQRVAALVGDEVVAQGTVNLPMADNRNLTYMTFTVRPAHRRRGIGTLLLEDLERRARDAGRSVLQVSSQVAAGRADPAVPFAAAHGYAAGRIELRNDLDITAGGIDRVLAPLEAEATAMPGAGDYDLLTWWDQVPQEWIDERAKVQARMVVDAPSGDLQVAQEVWDAARMREYFTVVRAQGRHMVETVAVHRPTGSIAGFTTLSMPLQTPDLAYQLDTLVVREHRARRLGQLVKAANLRALIDRRPQVTRVTTWNAEVNAPMLRVNRAMGFAPVGTLTQWQRVLP